MARKRGIPGDRLGRISEELSKASRGEFGAPSKYERALFPPSEPEPSPEPEPYPEEPVEEEEAKKSIRDLCEEVFLNYDESFNPSYPDSTRVKRIQFIPKSEDHVRDVIERMLAGGYRHRKGITTEQLIEGTIHVLWVNDKPIQGWEYENQKLETYIEFKDSQSKGKWVAQNFGKGSNYRGRAAP